MIEQVIYIDIRAKNLEFITVSQLLHLPFAYVSIRAKVSFIYYRFTTAFTYVNNSFVKFPLLT